MIFDNSLFISFDRIQDKSTLSKTSPLSLKLLIIVYNLYLNSSHFNQTKELKTDEFSKTIITLLLIDKEQFSISKSIVFASLIRFEVCTFSIFMIIFIVSNSYKCIILKKIKQKITTKYHLK